MRIQPAARISGQLSVPGDKSISHRAAIIAALADGSSHLSHYSTSQDCAATLTCLRSLGVFIHQQGNDVRVVGRGTTGLTASPEPLDCGNSGSTMRLLAGVLAGQNFDSVLTGDASLRMRPMKRIVEPLALMGARVNSKNNQPPLHINGSKPLQPIRYELPVASAQVKSCILLAALNANGRTEVVERLGPTRDHTERMLRWFGVPLETEADTIAINGPARFAARDVTIPGDISSAAFLIGAAALLPGSELRIQNVGLNPTRSQVLSLLDSLGFDVKIVDPREDCNEPLGDLVVRGKARICGTNSNRQYSINGPLIAQLIDELPLLAVLGTQLPGGLEIRDAAELRLKESDRIAATAANLRAMGAEVEEYEDGLAVTGPTSLHGAELNSFGDHRIAMAFAIGALLADGDSELSGADCVAVSFPEFFALLNSVAER
jgi:3-phosphoshikimate 1-carboxyvinyltransferase